MIFHATAEFSDEMDHPKGGYWIFKLAELMKNLPVKFVVAGPAYISGAIPENMMVLGKITDPKMLSALYSSADLTVLVSKKETFSMVVAESLCCGTPVVGFKAGGPEIIALPAFSKFIDQGDLEGFCEGINEFLRTSSSHTEISKMALEVYSNKHMLESYEKIYRDLINKD
jgi:glycosyltransferase involved in cell wall biosynthesis